MTTKSLTQHLSQVPQIDAVLPQILFRYRFHHFIKRGSKGSFILWQGALKLKRI